MLHVLSDGENRQRLVDERGREIGWIRGRAVRFFGIVSEAEAVRAAQRAWRALQDVLSRETCHARVQSPARRLRLVHDGAYEWITDGAIPIARLFRPKPFKESSFAIELVVPSYADKAVAVSAAHAIADSLRANTSRPPVAAQSADWSPD